MSENNNEKKNNLTWQYVGDFQDLQVFNWNGVVYSLIKTDTTQFVVKDVPVEPLRIGTAVKISKLDKAIRIGKSSLLRP